MQLEIDNYCFACGKENPIGLKLHFQPNTEGGVRAIFTPSQVHQGFSGIVHGGILSTILDEAMAHAVIAAGLRAVTARMEVNFKHPTLTEQELVVTAQITTQTRGLIKTVAAISQGNRVTVEAKATFVMVD